jgi:hypothetical protein
MLVRFATLRFYPIHLLLLAGEETLTKAFSIAWIFRFEAFALIGCQGKYSWRFGIEFIWPAIDGVSAHQRGWIGVPAETEDMGNYVLGHA